MRGLTFTSLPIGGEREATGYASSISALASGLPDAAAAQIGEGLLHADLVWLGLSPSGKGADAFQFLSIHFPVPAVAV